MKCIAMVFFSYFFELLAQHGLKDLGWRLSYRHLTHIYDYCYKCQTEPITKKLERT